jgi:hypothetical protein
MYHYALGSRGCDVQLGVLHSHASLLKPQAETITQNLRYESITDFLFLKQEVIESV